VTLRLGSLALAAALLLPACAPRSVPAPTLPEPEPVRLLDEDVQAIAALLRMEDGRVLDLRLVERLLRSPTPEVRGRAALAAGRLKDSRTTPLLLGALDDDDATVRARSAFSLGLGGDSSAVVVEALTRVAMRDAAPAVAAEAAASLGRLAVEQGRMAIDSALARADAPAPLRQDALLAAWRLRRDAGTTALAERHLADPDPETRWRAAYALMRMGGPAAVPVLIRSLQDPDERVRASAVRGLRAAVADSAGLRREAFEGALAAAAGDPHGHVRINALRMLPPYQDPARTTPVLIARLREEDANVAVAAAQALAEAQDPAAAGALRAMVLDTSRPDGLRTAALAAWVRIEPASGAPAAAAWADSSRWLLRYHAARALAAAPWGVGGATLQRLARDPGPLVAAEALAAMRAAADTAAPPRHIYLEALAAGDPLVRAAAALGLARTPRPADLDPLLNAWERAARDDVSDAAAATVQALGALARAGVPVQHAFYLRFGDGGPPRDAALHRMIAEQLPTPPASWGTPATAPEPRAPAFYVDVVRELVAPALAGDMTPGVAITTPHGEIVLELAAADAPLTVRNFLDLVGRGYYQGTRWHRVVPNFVIQDGDPRGDGSGGPPYEIRDELNLLRYRRGTLGMALSGPDTGGSQFFITHSAQPHLDAGYTIFGRVLDGMDAVDLVVQEEPILGFRRIR
jgi:cyclophilin family peptidyl-prolyl cis-trans isomerase/HEAT repeat protein